MRIRPFIGWAVFFFIAAIIVRAVPSPRGGFHFFRGEYYLRTKQFSAAEDAYRLAIDADPAFLRAYVELSAAYMAQEKYSEAEKSLKQAMNIHEDACAACGLGMVFREQKRNSEAETVLKRAIELDSTDACAYNQLGRLYYDTEDYPKAIEFFQKLNKIQSSAVNYHFLANASYESGKVEDSIQYYRQTVRLDPRNELAYIGLAKASKYLGRYSDATDALKQAIKIKPDNKQAHAFLGYMNFMQGNHESAMQEYRWLNDRDPEIAAQLLRVFSEASELSNELKKKRSAKVQEP